MRNLEQAAKNLATSVNLRQLADFIEQDVPDKKLNMRHFRSNKSGFRKDFVSVADCGTCGCALGWAPFVWPALESEMRFADDDERELQFERYARRVFPALFNPIGARTERWETCFSQHNSSKKKDIVNSLRLVAAELAE